MPVQNLMVLVFVVLEIKCINRSVLEVSDRIITKIAAAILFQLFNKKNDKPILNLKSAC